MARLHRCWQAIGLRVRGFALDPGALHRACCDASLRRLALGSLGASLGASLARGAKVRCAGRLTRLGVLAAALLGVLKSAAAHDSQPAPRPAAPLTRAAAGRPPGVMLEELAWPEATAVLTPDTVVVIPIGAAAKEHGPHLLLRNDYLLAEHLKRRLLERAEVVIAPTVNYHYYPAFVEYPGSTTLRLETARDLLIDICRSLARHGPRRFYALNTGVSTVRALQPAQEALAKEGIVLRYTNLLASLAPIEKQVLQQEGGTHADESETSMLLYLDPAAVDMSRAVKDYHPKRPGPFSRSPSGPGTCSTRGALPSTWIRARSG